MQVEELYSVYQQCPSVETDTRLLKHGDIFFALKGPNFNGNAFAAAAIEKGAAFAVIDEPAYAIPGKTFLVPDALKALQDLARFHRLRFSIPFIAITGSNGKTTTKELVSEVLSSSYKASTTKGNLNNHIGIPLTILRIPAGTEMAVIEMGANHQKEIEGYCKYTLPTHGIITNCGKAHLEGFGGEEGVRKGKGELYDFLRQNAGSAFVMWDYDYLREMSVGIREIIRYGTHDAFLSGRALQTEPFLEVLIESGANIGSIHTKLVGQYNLPNVLVSVAVGKYFHVPDEKIKSAIENYQPSNSRSQLIEKNGNKIILDAYNANPSSMKAAIENFASLHVPDKILMLGGMAELGDESLKEHQAIADLISNHSWKAVVLVGGDFLKLKHPYMTFENANQAAGWLKQQQWKGAYLLVKGSRSMQMEKVLAE